MAGGFIGPIPLRVYPTLLLIAIGVVLISEPARGQTCVKRRCNNGSFVACDGSCPEDGASRRYTPSSADLERQRQEQEHQLQEQERQRHQSDADAYSGQANIAFNRGDFETAVGWYQRALVLTPNDTGVRHRLATAQSRMGEAAYQNKDWTTAVSYFGEAVKNNPGEPYFAEWLERAEQKYHAAQQPAQYRRDDGQSQRQQDEQKAAQEQADQQRQKEDFLRRKAALGKQNDALGGKNLTPFEWPKKVTINDPATETTGPINGKLPPIPKFQKTENVLDEMPPEARKTPEAAKQWVESTKLKLTKQKLELQNLQLSLISKNPQGPESPAAKKKAEELQDQLKTTDKKIEQLETFHLDFPK